LLAPSRARVTHNAQAATVYLAHAVRTAVTVE
jgi:hypothetical protein